MKSKTFSIIISLLALTFSIIALCNVFPRQIPDFDYLGLIVGILSILTTVLIGWNIYSVLDIKKEWTKLKKELDETNKRVEEQHKENKRDFNDFFNLLLARSISLEGKVYESKDGYIMAYRNYVIALRQYFELGKIEYADDMNVKIGKIIRDMRAHKKKFIRDWDLNEDNEYIESKLYIAQLNKSEYNKAITIAEDLINVYPINIKFGDFTFKAFNKDVLIKRRHHAIYILIYKEGGTFTHQKDVFETHDAFKEHIMRDLESKFTYVAYCDAEYGEVERIIEQLATHKEGTIV